MSGDAVHPSRGDFRFGRRFRMRGAAAFDLAYAARARRREGPLLVYGRPNRDLVDAGETRLGLSVSRRCGNAVTRHRVKRLIREAFRTTRSELPKGYDLLVVVHPHAPLRLEDYRRLLRRAAEALDRQWNSTPDCDRTPPIDPPAAARGEASPQSD